MPRMKILFQQVVRALKLSAGQQTRRQLRGHDLRTFTGTEQDERQEWAERSHRGWTTTKRWRSVTWRRTRRHSRWSGSSSTKRFSWMRSSEKRWMNWHFVKVKKVCCALSSHTTNVGHSRRGPPLVDEAWHAMCQAMYEGVEGPGWEIMYFEHVEMHSAVSLKKPVMNKKAWALWALKLRATKLSVERQCGKRCGKHTWIAPRPRWKKLWGARKTKQDGLSPLPQVEAKRERCFFWVFQLSLISSSTRICCSVRKTCPLLQRSRVLLARMGCDCGDRGCDGRLVEASPSGASRLVATCRVARLTVQTRTLWLVGGCRDRPSRALPLTCPNVQTFEERRTWTET